jgi:AcrR family transcriptional regulator
MVAAGVAAPGDRREAQRLATREKLLEASVAEFKRNGFARTEIATIVEQARVSRGTFYFHFPTKDDVLAELRTREERRIFEEVSPRLANGEPLEGVLNAIVGRILDAEDRLGADLVREICAVRFRRPVVGSANLSDHPVGELVLAAVVQSAAGEPARGDATQRSVDLATIFLVGVFGLLSTYRGPSTDRDRLTAALVALTVKGVSAK